MAWHSHRRNVDGYRGKVGAMKRKDTTTIDQALDIAKAARDSLCKAIVVAEKQAAEAQMWRAGCIALGVALTAAIGWGAIRRGR
jgi:hypothetical protein